MLDVAERYSALTKEMRVLAGPTAITRAAGASSSSSDELRGPIQEPKDSSKDAAASAASEP